MKGQTSHFPVQNSSTTVILREVRLNTMISLPLNNYNYYWWHCFYDYYHCIFSIWCCISAPSNSVGIKQSHKTGRRLISQANWLSADTSTHPLSITYQNAVCKHETVRTRSIDLISTWIMSCISGGLHLTVTNYWQRPWDPFYSSGGRGSSWTQAQWSPLRQSIELKRQRKSASDKLEGI